MLRYGVFHLVFYGLVLEEVLSVLCYFHLGELSALADKCLIPPSISDCEFPSELKTTSLFFGHLFDPMGEQY